ncbi:MAG: hypothetical protein ACPG3X_07170 [Opitutales bacterium]
MPQELIDSVLGFIEAVVAYERGTKEFYIVLAASILSWVLVARLFMGLLRSSRGFISAFMALVVPLFLGLLAYGLTQWQVVPMVEAEWAEAYLPLGALVLVFFLMFIICSKCIFALSGAMSIFIFVLASAAAVGAYFGACVALETLEKGGQQIKQREERTNKAIDSVL